MWLTAGLAAEQLGDQSNLKEYSDGWLLKVKMESDIGKHFSTAIINARVHYITTIMTGQWTSCYTMHYWYDYCDSAGLLICQT